MSTEIFVGQFQVWKNKEKHKRWKMICAHVSIKKKLTMHASRNNLAYFPVPSGYNNKNNSNSRKTSYICANKNSLTHHYTVFGRFELAVYDEEVERGWINAESALRLSIKPFITAGLARPLWAFIKPSMTTGLFHTGSMSSLPTSPPPNNVLKFFSFVVVFA